MIQQFAKQFQYQTKQEIAVVGSFISDRSLGLGNDSKLANGLRNETLRE